LIRAAEEAEKAKEAGRKEESTLRLCGVARELHMQVSKPSNTQETEGAKEGNPKHRGVMILRSDELLTSLSMAI